MSLPRKHIAEGIAVAIVAGVDDVHRVLMMDPTPGEPSEEFTSSGAIVGRRSSCDSKRPLTLMRALESSVHAIGVCGKDVSDASRLFWTNPASFKCAQHDFYAMTNVNEPEPTGDR